MTLAFGDMLYLFGVGAAGAEPDRAPAADIGEIITLAVTQTVGEYVWAGLTTVARRGLCVLPPQYEEKYSQIIRYLTKRSYARADAVSETLAALSAGGIDACVVKGDVLGACYAIPEIRVSADVDMLISPEDLPRALRVLGSLGFDNTERLPDTQDSSHRSPKLGLLELHTSLSDERMRQVVLRGDPVESLLAEEPVVTEVLGCPIRTLGYTDTLIYTTVHMLHHLINSGASVRQLADILLFSRQYAEHIDFVRFGEVMRKYGFDRVCALTDSIGVRYLGLESVFGPGGFDAVTDPADADALLDDLEAGGWLGVGRDYDGSGWRYVGMKRATDRKGWRSFIGKYDRGGIHDTLFPDKSRIDARFPYAARFPMLRWTARIAWLFDRAVTFLRYRKSASHEVDDADVTRRTRLFERVGII